MTYVDVKALRDSGFLARLAGSRAIEEPEYQKFVSETHFDYQKDIDALAAAAIPGQLFVVLRGRFDWKTLSQYVRDHGGRCNNSYCQVPTGKAGHWASFLPIRSNLMGLAFSSDPSSAYMITRHGKMPRLEIPSQPLWVSLPHRVLDHPANLPPGAQSFAIALSGANRVTLSLAAPPDAGGGLTLQLAAHCDSPEQAKGVQQHLAEITTMLKGALSQAKQAPNSADLTGVLSSGTFQQFDRDVKGQWQISSAFVDAIAH